MKKIVSGMLLVAACCGLPSAWATNTAAVLVQHAVQGPQALRAVLQAVARAGNRLVAVGERGVILLSDDNGNSWRQAPAPVSASLTGVQFVDDRNGWATGHAGVVLHSEDAGETWALQLDGIRASAIELEAAQASGDEDRIHVAQRLIDDGPDKPFLALSFADKKRGLVTGAYGLVLATEDGGQTWQSWSGRVPNDRGLHLYAAARQGNSIYLAGEQGLLLRSTDGGEHFVALHSPYEGSYFAAALSQNGLLYIGGLRGHLFVSGDQGNSFQALANPIPASINSINVAQGRLLFTNQAGLLLHSGLKDFSAQSVPVSDGLPLTSVTQAADGSLIAVGMAGARRLPFLFTSNIEE
ncbi:YCF48-related protein [Pseudomonas sp. FP597]|uniref:WD40/YVTN/BNR-like repeat-containing protein n=1 Tax=Pseudomonas sp. FP597 TaxID=2954096 RepID=UPI0027332271|nr:YCF48-related protein [Pseudomonas sp. FP597]WLI04528.1 YCF48-related protein [Pseudomonas sp. FP597]